jgi:hypothetical protein
MILLYLGSAWLLGIYLASLTQPPGALLALATLIPLTGLILWRENPRVRLASVCALVLLLGAWRYSSAIPHFDEGSLAHYNGQGWGKLTGVVSDEPDVRDAYVNLRVAAESLDLGDQEYAVTGTVLVRAPRYPEYRYGDRLEIEGLLETPPARASIPSCPALTSLSWPVIGATFSTPDSMLSRAALRPPSPGFCLSRKLRF